MAALNLLPPEIVTRICALLGDELKVWSDKERQTDLSRLAPTCKALYFATVPLLYGGTVSLRSAGRTFLLARTLAEHADLRCLVHDLDLTAANDNGHPPSVIALLDLLHDTLDTLVFRPIYLTAAGTPMLRAALLSCTSLRSFTYTNEPFGTSALVCLAPFLQHWPQLVELTLRCVSVEVESGLWHPPPGVPRIFAECGPPPRYRLERLTLQGSSDPWTLDATKWVLGATDALQDLIVHDWAAQFPAVDLLTQLVARGGGPALEQLAVRDYHCVDPARSDRPSRETDRMQPEDLATWFPNLTHYTLQDDCSDDGRRRAFASAQPPHFVPGPKLRVLSLYWPWDDGWELEKLLQAREADASVAPALEVIRLVKARPSDPIVRLLGILGERAGVRILVEWM
ncbi:uncharacterized protein JCM10292_006274 [Rhodotorula paludigena]|uniref:uncharacterized protein n=1 Tax=Rhodotorula paludigena TaxID=86838 RepID=UPI00316F9936